MLGEMRGLVMTIKLSRGWRSKLSAFLIGNSHG